MLRSKLSENLQVRESPDVTGGHNGSSTLDATQMVLVDNRAKRQTDTEPASGAVGRETTSPRERAESWADETLVGELKGQLDTMKKDLAVLPDTIAQKRQERTEAIDRRPELQDMKEEEEGKYKKNVAELEKITGISLVGKTNEAVKRTLSQLRREWRPTEKQYERIEKSIKVAEKMSGKLPINSDERQNETEWKEAGEKAFTIKRLTINIWASMKNLEDIQRQIVVPREITAILPDLERKCVKLGKKIKDIKGEINRLCNSEEMKMENTTSNQETLIRNLGIDLQNARHRLRQVRRDIDKVRDEESALKSEIDSKKKMEEHLLKKGDSYAKSYNKFQASIEQKVGDLKDNIKAVEKDMKKMNSLLEMAKERRIPVPERTNAHPDPMKGKDPSTMEPIEAMEERYKLEGELWSLEQETMKITLDIKNHIDIPPGTNHLTFMQNNSEKLEEYLPFLIKQLDVHEALEKNYERLSQVLSVLTKMPYVSQPPESRPEVLWIRKDLSKLQERLSNLQTQLQEKEASAATINGEIADLNIQLSKENDALKTIKKGQASIQGRIDSIRGSI